MAYPLAFFALQLTFAQRLVERFALPLTAVVEQYTTLTRQVTAEHQPAYWAGFQAATDQAAWCYQWARVVRAPGPQPTDSTLYGRALFGCFHYSVCNDRQGNATIIRPHFIKNEQPNYRALSKERLAARRTEVRRMFVHIQSHVPLAKTLRGHSWLYNLAAYRRVYPAAYTRTLPAVDHDEFQYLSLWGQCFDRHWQPNATVVDELLRRLATLEDLTQLRFCFPYQVRRPHCRLSTIYQALDIAPSTA